MFHFGPAEIPQALEKQPKNGRGRPEQGLSWLPKARYSCLALGAIRIASFRSGCGPPGAQKARRKWLETLKKTGDVYQAGKNW